MRYVDWQGVKQIHTKRGFATKREALEYEREFLASKSRDLNMLFESFVEIYLSDLKPRIKYNTYLNKGSYYRNENNTLFCQEIYS
ncbi:hypothetical protein CE91St25_03230 [Campylobacter ureolyticus]|nr:hypothetical protein CE91St25_03230 [Campylobacter ureolyticus]